MADSAQQTAKRVLADLESLVSQGKLQPHQIEPLVASLDSLANPPPPPPIAARPPSTASRQRKRYRAIWSYNGVERDELSFAENDHIELVHEVSEGWWRGSVVRADGSLSEEGMFPSNYVEVIPDNALVPVQGIFSPPLPARNAAISPSPTGFPLPAASIMDDEKRASGYHPPQQQQQYQSLGPPKWQPGVARWSSGAPPMPPPPASNHFSPSPSPGLPPSQQGNYYNQSQPPYYGSGGPNDAYGQPPNQGGPLPNPTQPMPVTEEEKKKHDKLKKIGGKVGDRMLGGFAGGIGFGVGSSLINNAFN